MCSEFRLSEQAGAGVGRCQLGEPAAEAQIEKTASNKRRIFEAVYAQLAACQLGGPMQRAAGCTFNATLAHLATRVTL